MSNISFEHKGGDTSGMEEAARKNGFALGTLSVTIHEEHDARDSRDAAIDAASNALKVAEQMRSVEEKLRKKLESAEAAFHKERQEHTETKLAHAREVAELKDKIFLYENGHKKTAVDGAFKSAGPKLRKGRAKKS